jgi:dihydroxy-acid dehydratase
VLAARRANWKAAPVPYQSGTLWRYAQTVGDAERGAVTHPGGARETFPYSQI